MYPPIEDELDDSILESPIEDSTPTEEIPEEITISLEDEKKAFEDLLLSARNEDRNIRDEYLRVWKRLDYYWNNILDIFYDVNARDWRVPDWQALEESGEIPPRLINIYRPHGEAIVAALSVTIPSVIFHPDDADNPDDIEAAKSYRSVVELLQLHNEAPILFMKAICIAFNQGTIFGYNYYNEDKKFGTYKKKRIENRDIPIYDAYCPQCGDPLDGGVGNPEENYQCETCGYQGPAEINNTTETFPQIVGYDESPKGSTCQEVFSGLNIKVPAYARKQEECGYLLLEFAQSVNMLRSIFSDRVDEFSNDRQDNTWEGFAKLPITYYGQMPDNGCNVSCLWLRPFQFWDLGVRRGNLVKNLLKKYPSGCYAIYINDRFMEAVDEDMDEHWTFSKNPLGNFVYARPLAENLATVQDIRATLVEIEIQTAEYGIPETFADPKVLDFKKYGAGRAQPGMVTQAIPRPGKSLSDGFFQNKSATLSQEIDPLRQHIDQDAQFVVGSFPSVYGGPAQGGSKTASEYSQSRAVALQRLGSVWKLLCIFWSDFQSRSAVEYVNALKSRGEDERFTKKEGEGFVNVWIRNSSLSGKIGRVEPEASEQLPSSWGQIKDTIVQILTGGLPPEMTMVLAHPRNSGLMKKALGLQDIYIPGDDARVRQLKEFSILSQGIPVPTNPLVDDEEVHIQVLQSILEGPMSENLSEEGYQAAMMHLSEHMQSMAQKAATEAMNNPQPGTAPDKPKENKNGD